MSSGVSIFICGRKNGASCSEATCHDHAATACTFKLAGRKEGQLCGRKLCSKHGAGAICPPHQRLLAARAAT